MLVTPDLPLADAPSGAMIFVTAGGEPQSAAGEKTLHWLRRAARFGTRIGSINTGAFALAQSGVLAGDLADTTFTLHWEDQPAFVEHFPELTPSSTIFEITPRLISCGGGHAATDLILTLIEEKHGE